MSKFFKLSIFASVLAIAIVFAFSPSPAQAAGHETFDLYVRHNINGRSLGLDKELPVDVYVNLDGELIAVLTFSFGEIIEAELPAGEYFIEVRLAGADATSPALMSLGPTDIPAGVNVAIRATLGAQKTPTLRVVVR
jgi:hypothetical protein